MSESRRYEVGTMRRLLDASGLPAEDPVVFLRGQGSPVAARTMATRATPRRLRWPAGLAPSV